MNLRFAFAGFRHFHILSLYALVQERQDATIERAAEEDEATADNLAQKGVSLSGRSLNELFAEPEAYDVVAIGDYYARRGSLAIRALELGKHVLLDKPICTTLAELERIRALSKERHLSVGCMLDLRNSGFVRTIRRVLNDGTIGKLQTINYMGQHPLLYGTRAQWYFEEGKHGGSINDIAIHAMDCIPYVTGQRFVEVICARVWNSRLPGYPHLNIGAQLMMRMDDETGVLGDVSYLSPDSQGYAVPQYWRFTFHGTEGVLEAGLNMPELHLWPNGSEKGQIVALEQDRKGGYLVDFFNEIAGHAERSENTTGQILEATRIALCTQQAADEKRAYVAL